MINKDFSKLFDLYLLKISAEKAEEIRQQIKSGN